MAHHIKFTKTVIDTIPFSEDKQVFYRDTVTIGFGLCVGKTKSYFAEKKMPTGKSKRKVIGKHGVYTLDQARAEAKRLLIMMDEGIDPVQKKRNFRENAIQSNALQKQIPTLGEAFEIYKDNKKLSDSSITAYTSCVNDYFADWKNIQLHKITKKMVIDRHAELSKRSPAQANLAAKFLHALFNLVILRFLDDSGNKILSIENPVKIVKEQKAMNKIKRRRSYIRSDQHEEWALAVATTYHLGEQNNDYRAYTNQDYFFMLALTGFRRNEAESAEWENVDLKFGTIKVKDTKNGEDLLLPMGDILWYLMRERKKRATPGNKYIFQERSGDGHIIDRRGAKEKIIENSGISFTFHDLRRTFSTVANSLAIGSYTIKRLINHTSEDNDNDVTDGYVQVSFDDLRKAMNMIEDVIIPESVRDLIRKRIFMEKGNNRNAQKYWIEETQEILNNFLKNNLV
ncbi:integrase family protein [Acinetobacter sp. NIPH 2699]|uniref:tyrosine-type recombinase/integrase n=1 Tax=Acinetobacter sp. NIPH 2699 TaxID=2923433 RepID=UPI001F4A773E|nr:integrase family protein [Acinetobacter sp. NIPH 2699]MCH7337430.1 integrase family protein [Acinetobacter sp. NIPH 2699]